MDSKDDKHSDTTSTYGYGKAGNILPGSHGGP